MPLVYMAVKALKRRAKKAYARHPLDHHLLTRAFAGAWGLSMSALSTTPFAVSATPSVPSKKLQAPVVHPQSVSAVSQLPPFQPPSKRPRNEATSPPPRITSSARSNLALPPPSAYTPPTPKASKGKTNAKVFNALLDEFQAMMGERSSPQAIQKAVGNKSKCGSEAEKQSMRSLIGQHCLGCFMPGRGIC